MSWSIDLKGKALDVARRLELEAEQVQKDLSASSKEKSLHARAVALLICACHEQPGNYVQVKANGSSQGVNGCDQYICAGLRPVTPEEIADMEEARKEFAGTDFAIPQIEEVPDSGDAQTVTVP